MGSRILALITKGAPFLRFVRPSGSRAFMLAAAFAITTGRTDDLRAEPLADRIDSAERERIRDKSSRAIDLLSEGEAALGEGRLERADELFSQVEALVPGTALPSRRRCQALTRLGRRSEAIDACRRAVSAIGSGRDLRATAAAVLATPGPLDPLDIVHVTRLQERAYQVAGREEWWAAIQCDLARRLGDQALLRRCARTLEELAPDSEETRAASSAAVDDENPWLRWIGVAMLLGLCVGTGGHAARAGARARRASVRSKKVALVTVAVLTLSGTLSVRAGAQNKEVPEVPLGALSTEFPIDLDDPMASLPSPAERKANPLQFGYFMMDLSMLADRALKKARYAEAAKYYEVVVKAAPKHRVGYSKLCQSRIALEETEAALEPCLHALSFEGARIDDYTRYARLLLQRTEGTLPKGTLEEVEATIEHLKGQGDPAVVAGLSIECELAVRTESESRLQRCSYALAEKAPDAPTTISYQWALAMMRHDFFEAERLVRRARQVEMPEEALRKLEARTAMLQPLWQKALPHWRHIVGVFLVLVAMGIVIATWRRTGRRPPSRQQARA